MIIDFDELGAEECGSVLENTRYPNRCIHPQMVSSISRDIGEWEDSHPLNMFDEWRAEFDKLFVEE